MLTQSRATVAVATRATLLGGILVVLGCMPGAQVRTASAPDANLTERRTFQILPTPSSGRLTLGQTDPMLDNSITNRALRDQVRIAFESKGYVNGPNPDFTVAIYATAQPKLDITNWNYGYTWRGLPAEATDITEYERGTVIIDVINAKSKELLWRGRGVATVSPDPDLFSRQLNKTVSDIMSRYPEMRRATP